MQVPNQSISHLYPTDDNYEQHPTNPSLRCPKSLTDLCIDAICRSLPNLEGELPPGLPPDVVDRIISSLTSHAALNSTTLRTLSNCEFGSLSLANCRGVSDEWLIPLSSSSVSSVGSPANRFRSGSIDQQQQQRLRSASTASYDYPKNHSGYSSPKPPLRDVHPTQFAVPSNDGQSSSFLDGDRSSSMMMDLDDYDEMNSGNHAPNDGQLQQPALSMSSGAHQGQSLYNTMDDESRSTSSFVSASSTPYAGSEDRPASPLLPSVLPPPEFFSLKHSSGPSSSLWLYPTRDNSMMAMPLSQTVPLLPSATSLQARSGSSGNANNSQPDFAPSTASVNCNTTSTLTLLDLRGSQRLTDRGLLQLTHTPLRSLEVVRLDNCHGITGKGLLAFSRSRLHTLSMANCRRLTDEAVVNISHLGASLMTLNLGGCRCLTDRSLEALSELLGLRQLDLSQVRWMTFMRGYLFMNMPLIVSLPCQTASVTSLLMKG